MSALLTMLCAAALTAGPRVVVDPGHGGNQEGALSSTGYQEKVLSLALAHKLQAELERRLDAEVTLTRVEDMQLGLAERVAMTNHLKPDLFVSLHANSMPTRQLRKHSQGIETFFLSASASGSEASTTADRENAESPKAGLPNGDDVLAFILADLARSETHGDSSRLAYAIHQQLIARLGAVDRGVQQAPFYVLMGVEAPAVLVEVGFISHPEEGKRLEQAHYQQKLAEAIAEGVQVFWQEELKREAAGSKSAKP
jgi:N-acetylmuramoyl-L-alanine amidase